MILKYSVNYVITTPKTGLVYIFTVFLMLQQCLSASVMEGAVEVVSGRVERARECETVGRTGEGGEAAGQVIEGLECDACSEVFLVIHNLVILVII